MSQIITNENKKFFEDLNIYGYHLSRRINKSCKKFHKYRAENYTSVDCRIYDELDVIKSNLQCYQELVDKCINSISKQEPINF